MKIYLYAWLFALVPYVNPMASSSDNQPSDTRIIIKNNTTHSFWFSINAGGTFTKVTEGLYDRRTAGISVFCGELSAGKWGKSAKFTNGLFLTAKVAKKESLLSLSGALCAVGFNPEVLKDIAMLRLDYNEKNGLFFSIEKQHTFCYLCMKIFKNNDQKRMLKPCGHCFHTGCYNPIQKERSLFDADEKGETALSQYCPFCGMFIDSFETTKIGFE